MTAALRAARGAQGRRRPASASAMKESRPPGGEARRWLLLIHQLPPKPPYLRAKVGRRLRGVGAVPLKSTVYALPATDAAREDFEWITREIAAGGGTASVCEARFLDGLTDEQVEDLFRAARDEDYRGAAEDARGLARELPRRGRLADEARARLAGGVERLRRRIGEIVAIDYFHAHGRDATEGLVSEIEERLRAPGAASAAGARATSPAEYRARTWVTRRGVYVDRIASAWLVRRFIDPEARFKFVEARGYAPAADEIRFDMFDAEFTHEGDRCTFEVLLDRFRLDDAALRAIAEIVHDIDLKDGKFGRPDTAGVGRVLGGIALAHADDGGRLARGEAVLSDLYESLRRRRP